MYWNINNNIIFQFSSFPRNINDKFSKNAISIIFSLFWSHFAHFWPGWDFSKKSVLTIIFFLILGRYYRVNSKKKLERFLRKAGHRWTYGQAYGLKRFNRIVPASDEGTKRFTYFFTLGDIERQLTQKYAKTWIIYKYCQQKQSPRGFLYNFFKFRKIHSETFENTNVGVLFLIKPIQHRYFPVSLANFQEQLVYKTTPDDCFQGRSTQRSGLKGVSQPPPKKKRKKKTK